MQSSTRKHEWLEQIFNSELPPPARHIAMYLATHMNEYAETVWPSLTTITSRTGLSRPTVVKHLTNLESAGYLRKTSGGIKDGKNISNRYEPVIGSKGDLLGVVKDVNQGSKAALPELSIEVIHSEVSNKRSMSGSRLTRTDEILQTATEVIDWLNIKTGKKFQAVNGTLRPVVARLRELTGPDYRFDLDAAKTICMTVVADQTEKWIGDEKMRDYLTTKTLFRDSNFPVYAADIIDHNIRLRDEQCTNAPSATHRSTPTSPTFAPTEDAPGNDRSESQTESLPLREIFSRRLSQKNAQH